MVDTPKSLPVLPRRAFVAGGLSALVAGGAVALSLLGGLTAVRTETFAFSRGVSLAGGEEDRLRGFLAGALADERIQVTILGHTGSTGNAAANTALSEERAALVSSIAADLGFDASRVTARGVGGASGLPRAQDESDRAYQARLARVEISLQMRK